jgi:RNA polymerase sigma-70 factor (ECF subfamily)
MLPPKPDAPASPADPASCLVSIFRDFPGLRALIMRRVNDPEAAADILQDAVLTTLEKLRNGQIANPENVGGYLYRVALNHLRNFRRKDRGARMSGGELEFLTVDDSDGAGAIGEQWAQAARRVLEAMPRVRDREVLVRFYLNEEGREHICREMRLSRAHFNRVIFRARNRFRDLLERSGLDKADLIAIAVLSLVITSGKLPFIGAWH